MSLLTEPLPDFILVQGEKYSIKTDFPTWIQFEEVMLNRDLDIYSKITAALKLCFDPEKCKRLPPSIDGILPGMYNFFLCGRETRPRCPEKGSGRRNQRIFSYSEDAEYIYAAFLEQYGIDLCTSRNLHWWRFSALFKGLNENVRLMKIISYRSIDSGSVSDSAKRTFYSKMKKLYALPDNRSEEQKEMDMAQELSELF